MTLRTPATAAVFQKFLTTDADLGPKENRKIPPNLTPAFQIDGHLKEPQY